MTAKRVAVAAIITVIICMGFWLRYRCVTDPAVAFLAHEDQAPWIVYPLTPKIRVRSTVLLDTRFRQTIHLNGKPAKATLTWRAFRLGVIKVNGSVATSTQKNQSNWKLPATVDLSPYLQAGDNELELIAYNDRGPGAFSAHLHIDQQVITTNTAWQASVAGSTWRQARLADDRYDTAGLTPDFPLPTTWTALSRHVILLLGSFAVIAGALLFLRKKQFQLTDKLVTRCMIGAAGLWTVLWMNNMSRLGVIGYDAKDHLAYMQYILDHGQLPRAEQGIQMFQPPLYYMLSAGLLSLFGLNISDPAALYVLRIESLAFGLIHLFAIAMALRVLLPGQHAKQLVGIAVAAFLPMHLYLFQYPTNEALGGALVSVMLYLAVVILKRHNTPPGLYAAMGVCMGLALLARVTSVIAIVIVLTAIMAQMICRCNSLKKWLSTLGIAAVATTIVSGWYWLMIWQRHGRLLLTGWDASTQSHWWQDEGYRTASYFSRFGQCLVQPVFSSFGSFADGIYSTLFGDGMVAGRSALIINAVPWQMDLMIAGYLMAVVPACMILLGAGIELQRIIRRPDYSRFILLALPAATVLAMIHISLKIPTFVGGTKAFYAIGAMLPLCVFAAEGFDVLARRHLTIMIIITALLGTWCVTSYKTYWINRHDPDVYIHLARQEVNQQQAQDLVQKALVRDPQHVLARIIAGQQAMHAQQNRQAVDILEKLLSDKQTISGVSKWLAIMYQSASQPERAQRYYQQAVNWNPDDGAIHYLYAGLLMKMGRTEDAINQYRQALHAFFDDAKVHADLAKAYRRMGQASRHDRIAGQITIAKNKRKQDR